METFTSGKYLGQNSEQVKFDGFVVTKSSYKEALCSDWHQHENIYMTLILKGGSKEKRKKMEIDCSPGMLLSYSKQETHKNINYQRNSKNLHIEFADFWLKKFDITASNFVGQSQINNPLLKCQLINSIGELQSADKQTELNLETALLAAISVIPVARNNNDSPEWVEKLYQLLHDETEADWDLSKLSQKINVHPVTISKYFPKYFKVNIGDYIRMIKIEKSMPLLSKKSISLENVALQSGFVDNAHYTRMFKKYTGITPSGYRELVAG